MTPEDLCAALATRRIDCSITEARRLLGHVISEGRTDLVLRRPPRRAVLQAVDALFDRERLEVLDRVKDGHDGFVKYLFRHRDGALTEAVRIPLEKPGRFTVCLSSQVGCAMRCAFCATGRLGLTRSLEAWEMVAALATVRDELATDPSLDALRESGVTPRVSGAVFQGQGEPFHNYDAVIQAARVLSNPCGGRITQEAITISTVGLVPQIERYAREGHVFRLIVSLTSAVEEKRKTLLPVAGRFSMRELVRVLREHQATLGKRITLAWVLMRGVNHGEDELEALSRELGELSIRLNLIDVNDATGTYEMATDEERIAFVGRLHAAGIATQRRYSGGKSEHAACGMLAAKHRSGSEATNLEGGLA
ncbi:MAG: radical SAM protein [Deltaproteobacteria bacterium]|nr:radical SAM protein [Deltaproteobacteria bacterium]